MKPSSEESAKILFWSFMFQRSGVKDKDTVRSAKVTMEAPPKEPDSAPLDPPPISSPKEDVLISVSDSVAKKSRPQPHTTTAFLLQGELGVCTVADTR